MICVRPRIDDVANGLRRDALDRGQYGRRVGSRPGVHYDDAVLAYLHADVRAGASDHEKRGANLQDFQAV